MAANTASSPQGSGAAVGKEELFARDKGVGHDHFRRSCARHRHLLCVGGIDTLPPHTKTRVRKCNARVTPKPLPLLGSRTLGLLFSPSR